MEDGRNGAGSVEESSFSCAAVVVGYASGKTKQSFLQAIDKGMYEMDKSDRKGLSQDDEKRLGFLSGDEDEDDAGSVVGVNSDVDSLISKGGRDCNE